MEEVSGYDAEFVEEIPGHLKCVKCHMVLKNPLQLADCGHRFCSDCFTQIKDLSERRKDVLCCPNDQTVIDVDLVFEDKAIQRIILDLKVKCNHVKKGCHWLGDLRDLEHHLAEDCFCEWEWKQNLSSMPIFQQMSERIDLIGNSVSSYSADIEHKYQELAEKNQKAQHSCDKFSSHNQNLLGNVQKIANDTEDFQGEISNQKCDLQNEFNKMKNKVEELQNTIAMMEESMEKIKKLSTSPNTLVDNVLQTMKELQRRLSNQKNDLESKIYAIKKLKEEMESANDAREDEIEELAFELKNL